MVSSSIMKVFCGNSAISSSSIHHLRFSPNYSIRYRTQRANMCRACLPENSVVVGFGMAAVDFMAAVDAFPNPDEKIRSTAFKVQGGGNAGNALTCAAHLGLNPRIISKVANDSQGRGIIEEFEADGVDTSFLVVSEEGNSTFSYNIVDNQTKTRTSIYTPGYPPLTPHDFSQSTLSSALDTAKLMFFDGFAGVGLESTLLVAQEATQNNIPILVEAESVRAGLENILNSAEYVVCSTKFPQAWTGIQSQPSALFSILLQFPKAKFVIVTLGEDGCIMLERSRSDTPQLEEMDVDNLLELLKQKKDDSINIPTCISSLTTKLRGNRTETINGRLFLGTAEKIPQSELVDTTGAGDAFVGAVLYAICANMPPEKMLPFAAQVAAINCRALGARGGLPYRTDPRLARFLD